MNTTSDYRGVCLCGSVRLRAKKQDDKVGVCHCDTCRQWDGGPLMVAECGSDVTFEGEASIATFASSEWAERGFCKHCGTHLFFRLKAGDFFAVPVGLLEGGAEWRLDNQVFIEQKPAFYSFAEKTQTLTGEELFAKHS